LRHTQQKARSPPATGVVEKNGCLGPVIANGLDRAAFLGFLAASFFLRRLRLF
jgi:hypothetical protein